MKRRYEFASSSEREKSLVVKLLSFAGVLLVLSLGYALWREYTRVTPLNPDRESGTILPIQTDISETGIGLSNVHEVDAWAEQIGGFSNDDGVFEVKIPLQMVDRPDVNHADPSVPGTIQYYLSQLRMKPADMKARIVLPEGHYYLYGDLGIRIVGMSNIELVGMGKASVIVAPNSIYGYAVEGQYPELEYWQSIVEDLGNTITVINSERVLLSHFRIEGQRQRAIIPDNILLAGAHNSGIALLGVSPEYCVEDKQKIGRVQRLQVEDVVIEDTVMMGIVGFGEISHVSIVDNRIMNTGSSGVQFEWFSYGIISEDDPYTRMLRGIPRDLTIEGNEILNSGSDLYKAGGVLWKDLDPGDDFQISKVGIRLSGVENILVQDNTIIGAREQGILLWSGDRKFVDEYSPNRPLINGYPIAQYPDDPFTHDNRVLSNTIELLQSIDVLKPGIEITNWQRSRSASHDREYVLMSDNVIAGNTLRGTNGISIRGKGVYRTEILRNKVYDGPTGILVWEATEAILSDNLIRGSEFRGIDIRDAKSIEVVNNVVESYATVNHTGCGIYLRHVKRVEISQNQVGTPGNFIDGLAVQIASEITSTYVHIEGNEFPSPFPKFISYNPDNLDGFLAENNSVRGEDVIYDFVSNLDQASISNARQVAHVTSDVVWYQDAIYHHPNPDGKSTITFRDVAVPSNAVLRFHIGYNSIGWEKSSDGTLMEILVNGTVVFGYHLDPKNRLSDRRWLGFEIDLQPYADQSATITFSTSAYQIFGYEWVYWVNPRIVLTR